MKRKIDLIASIKISRTNDGIEIRSNKDFFWDASGLSPEVAMTSVVCNTLHKTLKYEDYFSGEYTVELKIRHKQDE